MNLRLFLREPALLLDAVETLLVLLVAFGLGLTGDQQNYIVAAVVAALGLAKGFATKPFPVMVLTDFARALFVLVASFGLENFLTPDRIAVLVTFIGTLTTLIARAQVTPTRDPVVAQGGAGAGPVRGKDDAGRTTLETVGIAIAAIALFLILLDLLVAGVAFPLTLLLVLLVVGVVLWAVGASQRRRF